MKRILVLSDSHGNVNNMVTAVGRLHPDMIIHLGDCWADAEQLHRKFPMTVMEQVPGNCDCRQEVQERILLIEGKKILPRCSGIPTGFFMTNTTGSPI